MSVDTVMLHVAVQFPSSLLAVMAAVPSATAFTLPSASTVAMLESLLDHTIFLFVALSGYIVAVSLNSILTKRVLLVAFRVIDETLVGSTVISQVADLSPAIAVMVAEPTFTAVTTPSLTVAMLASDVDHVTVLSVASDGETVAVRVTVSPAFRVAVVLSRVIDETSVGSTVTSQVAD